MQQATAQVIDFSKAGKRQNQTRSRDRLNAGKSGRVYARGGKLWLDFHYLGERVRESSGLDDNPANRVQLRKMLDLIVSQIENGVFEFGKGFPHRKRVEHFARLEGRTFRRDPKDVLFKDYLDKWWKEMGSGMSASQVRDYTSIINTHLLPYFGDLAFSEFRPVLMKKFLAFLRTKETSQGTPLSSKRIHNILIPLRVIFKDACGEYGWNDLGDPFSGLKLPKVQRMRIHPLSIEEWKTLKGFIPAWYRPYFEFAVLTGLRPSEQVALKWDAIDERFIHVELSRVRNVEKADLKTAGSNRRIEIRPSLREVLKAQKKLTTAYQSPFVFLNNRGRPVNQVSV